LEHRLNASKGAALASRKRLLVAILIVVTAATPAEVAASYGDYQNVFRAVDYYGVIGSSAQNSTSVSFSFNETLAVSFYSQLSTSIGLEEEYPGSHTIWLADDQALDYYALLSIYNSTHDSDALNLAQQISGSIVQWGGLWKYWNPVFEVIGRYPNTTEVMCGTERTINQSYQGYTINATVFTSCPCFNYSRYADELAYRVLLDLHTQNCAGAESEFSKLSTSHMWDGHGFVDEAFQKDPTHTYQSYKLADYVIAWKALNQSDHQFAQSYVSTVNNAATIMSSLQSNGSSGWPGGVWTGYRFSNGQLVYGNGVSLENGETTSLFVLATQTPAKTTTCRTTSTTSSTIPPVNTRWIPGFSIEAILIGLVGGLALTLVRRGRSGRSW
jgi:hypothetical protein